MSSATTRTLECVERFYWQQRIWVYHARIALESTVDERMNAPSDYNAPTSISARPTLSPAPSIPPSTMQATRWRRRKNRFRLKLEGISVQHPRYRPVRGPPNGPTARLLEMFSNRLDAGMESCQRLQRLVRHADVPTYGA
ncbi:hypothetical protein FKP32DRAFT_1559344 [Trametes sanguinea]|nr:hypothetical protein FKP32DRAFT_1559344 [Trametes sanguinea]